MKCGLLSQQKEQKNALPSAWTGVRLSIIGPGSRGHRVLGLHAGQWILQTQQRKVTAAEHSTLVGIEDKTSQLWGDKRQPRDRHSHKQENVKGQVWTMEKAQQEEWGNFLSAPLETERRQKSLGAWICARVNIGTNRVQARVSLFQSVA